MTRLEVVRGGKQEKESLLAQRRNQKIEGYRRSYFRHKILNHVGMAVYYGISYYSKTAVKNGDIEGINIELAEMQYIRKLMLLMSVRELSGIFPISKEYDGKKYECKDYWSTMEYIGEIDADSKIGDESALDEFFWNYYNPLIIGFSVKEMLYVDKIARSMGHKGMLESVIEEMGLKDQIHTYTYDRDNGVMIDNKTGETHEVLEYKPKNGMEKYIKIEKGGEGDEGNF